MKKIITLILALGMIISATACGANTGSSSNSESKKDTTSVTEKKEETKKDKEDEEHRYMQDYSAGYEVKVPIDFRIDDVDIIISTLWSHILLEDAYATENCVSDFRRIMYGDSILTFTDFNTEHIKCLAFLKNAVENSSALKRIVVTHHVPSFRLVSLEFKGSKINGAFVAELYDYISDSNLDFWIYGHSHRNIDATIGTTKCVSNQLGYVFKNEHMTFDNQRCFII